MIHRNVIPSYVTDVIRTNKRRFISRSPVFAVQDQYDSTYDAYDVDIGENATYFVSGSSALVLWYMF